MQHYLCKFETGTTQSNIKLLKDMDIQEHIVNTEELPVGERAGGVGMKDKKGR